MDANGTRYHLLLGKADWGRCFDAEGMSRLEFAAGDNESAGLGWDNQRSELILFPRQYVFLSSDAEKETALAERRGAARDEFGNWYWIGPDQSSIHVKSTGAGAAELFWRRCDGVRPEETHGDFKPVAAAKPIEEITLAGLAITQDNYLVVGMIEPAGYLVFDLFGGGPPLQFLWPESVAFEPFDLAPRPGGGVWILDRAHQRIWGLDHYFRVNKQPLPQSGPASDEEAFVPVSSPSTPAQKPASDRPQAPAIAATDAWPLADPQAVAIEALPDDSVLILHEPTAIPDEAFSFVGRYHQGRRVGSTVSLDQMTKHVEQPRQGAFRLVGHDFAFTADPDVRAGEMPRGRIYVAGNGGNQSFAFHLSFSDSQLQLNPLSAYFPMRTFGGKGIVSAGVEVFYDTGASWVPLVEQSRPRYDLGATLLTFPFDGREPGCIWHRLMIDGGIPAEAQIQVMSRTADEEEALNLAPWRQEPNPRRRAGGSELPFVPKPADASSATHELLFQEARGRFVQLKITLRGNGRTTPRLRALRAYYPRFSYLREYLPAVYREDAESASFLDRFLANPEGILTAVEDKIASVHALFDGRTAPAEALGWLAGWFGLRLDPAWNESKERLFLQHAMDFFECRGTVRGMQMALRLALEETPGAEFFSGSTADRRCAERFRIVEKFRTRRTPGVQLGDPSDQFGPREIQPAERWKPDDGAQELHRRYREFLAGRDLPISTMTFPLAEPTDEAEAGPWRTFARSTLGFVPAAVSNDLERWRDFLANRYGNVPALNADHGTNWTDFNNVPLPSDAPNDGPLRDDWNDFVIESVQLGSSRREALWRLFLARRYRLVADLNAVYGTNWQTFAQALAPRELPTKPDALLDWFEFESIVLAMHQAAHKFIVLLPVSLRDRNAVRARQGHLELARRLIELEKPAHTAFDVRFYWAFFRVGEARLGNDTLVGSGSRAPELLTPLILNQTYLAECYLAPTPPNLPARLRVGTDSV